MIITLWLIWGPEEIGVKSVINKGSTFWFTALFEKQKDINEKKPFAPQDIRGRRFLIVDDNKTYLDILKGYLESWGCLCDVAQSGEIALSSMNAVAKVNSPFDAFSRAVPTRNHVSHPARVPLGTGLSGTARTGVIPSA